MDLVDTVDDFKRTYPGCEGRIKMLGAKNLGGVTVGKLLSQQGSNNDCPLNEKHYALLKRLALEADLNSDGFWTHKEEESTDGSESESESGSTPKSTRLKIDSYESRLLKSLMFNFEISDGEGGATESESTATAAAVTAAESTANKTTSKESDSESKPPKENIIFPKLITSRGVYTENSKQNSNQ